VPFFVGGGYQVSQGGFLSLEVCLVAVGINQAWQSVLNVVEFGFAPRAFLVAFVVAKQPAALFDYAFQQAFRAFQKLLLIHATPILM
jgi:hypothetical protein